MQDSPKGENHSTSHIKNHSRNFAIDHNPIISVQSMNLYEESATKMNPILEFAPCAFCQLIDSELENRELEAEESLMYRHHMRVEHGMTV